jgi:UDP-N-acetylmuramyl pentapeptide phosphotransferase/UDP-N-acetylglucosamine-1-phosphate transferase
MTALISYTLILALSAMAFAWVSTWALLILLPKLALMDLPNARSNHENPVPRGGGIAVVLAMLFFLIISGIPFKLITALLAVALISLLDDWTGQPATRRLLVHIIASVLAVSTIHNPVFQGYLPSLLDQALAIMLLTYFLNIYNFMDGIDEITSVQTVSMSIGLAAIVCITPGMAHFIGVDALIMAGAIVGFWYFNRHPAKIFLGDVGSVPIGLFVGYLLLMLASQGEWAAALILPAYYLTDATITLLSRMTRRAPLMQAHSEHAYQRAVRRGMSHRVVVRHILSLNLLLILLAAISTLESWLALICVALAYGTAGVLTLIFYGKGGHTSTSEPASGHA